MQSSSTARVFPQLPAELTDLIVRRLHPNEAATSFRLVSKAAAAQFRGPEHTTVRLSRPVPPHAFAAKWLAPGATRGLTLERRRQLISLTAASGVVANLEVAVRAAGFDLALHRIELLTAAAGAGSLDSCKWLWERHPCPPHDYVDEALCYELCGALEGRVLHAAARGGHQHICEWLFTLDVEWEESAVADAPNAAARGGHPELADWLLQWYGADPNGLDNPIHRLPNDDDDEVQGQLVIATAEGCDLAALQHRVQRDGWGYIPYDPDDAVGGRDSGAKALAMWAATGSRTPDWRAKVEWLAAQGAQLLTSAQAALAPDAPARLAWLHGRGHALRAMPGLVNGAAEAGNVAALQYLLAEVFTQPSSSHHATDIAAGGGHLAALQALHAAGWAVHCPRVAQLAALGGHLHVVAWLVEALGAEALPLDAWLFSHAARSGSVELMAWLRDHGCPWDKRALVGAAESGCEEAVEWLVARGCPMPGGHNSAYELTACDHGDLAMLRCLWRLGVPWGHSFKSLFEDVIDSYKGGLPALRWLLEVASPAERASVRPALQAWGKQHFHYRFEAPAAELLALLGWLSQEAELQH
ncbi:hypothetical protein GPECTOR_20g448 [Gonium pectorale]|uniref:Uncharacterized protein n=1 Tax=Gonium pectorale TaxID=33097 RepID=A0A150GIE6_GONPE|nr:hypothetical protein GPECTOR_20g448 [Gonium pectorale]|eukprot:KXZ49592.1 hypothetical protein GPECTOR_20g448 [Gonium pectorale]